MWTPGRGQSSVPGKPQVIWTPRTHEFFHHFDDPSGMSQKSPVPVKSDGGPLDVENSPLVVNGVHLDVTPNNIPSKGRSDMSTISSTFSDVSLGNSGCKPGDFELGVPGDVNIKPVVLDFNSMSPSPCAKVGLHDADLDTPPKDDFGNGPGSSGMSMVSRGSLKRSLDTSTSSGGDYLVTPKKKW